MRHLKIDAADMAIVALMSAPTIAMFVVDETGALGAFLMLIAPVPVGLTLAWYLARRGRKALAWFCFAAGLFPLGSLVITLTGIAWGWWSET